MSAYKSMRGCVRTCRWRSEVDIRVPLSLNMRSLILTGRRVSSVQGVAGVTTHTCHGWHFHRCWDLKSLYSLNNQSPKQFFGSVFETGSQSNTSRPTAQYELATMVCPYGTILENLFLSWTPQELEALTPLPPTLSRALYLPKDTPCPEDSSALCPPSCMMAKS